VTTNAWPPPALDPSRTVPIKDDMNFTPRSLPARRRWIRILAAITIVGATAIALVGCSTSSPKAGPTTITLYNAQHEQTTTALIKAFTAKTGIAVKVDNDDEDVLTAKIEQEGPRSPADVIFTENSNWLQQLADKGLLAKVTPSTLAAVPTADSAKDGEWVGVSARVSALVYNTKDLTPAQLPKSVLDLADPKWKGKIEIAPSETDFWPVVSSVEDTYGHAKALAWLEGLKANAGANVVPDNETITADVNRGVAEIGIINHYYWHRLVAEDGASSIHSALGYFAPGNAGYIKTISGAAVLTSSSHSSAAQKFVAFLVSHDGQEAIAHSESFEYPLAPGVAPNLADTPLSQLSPSGFSAAEFGTGTKAKKLLQEAQLL
jgi:iron(III) transport system substrate-binding protein